ncbi:helix-turn-helix domain-containing protein [Methylovirgula sp. 4M-Z18]|uniref:helix-turn-helix domain-containing protein n=1 Tax=Methylovirgula sp. 4M-Z18 TaxID=2293567 RepID=UPI000E2E5578|nr:helix-turn-helix domain-containing protein [Methylovirgula sp. 4M-Z18]RFB78055.1 XRE family transcriptional regulator [Methylovirgula sp. 4M-Z18]
MTPFGEKLRELREARGITLKTLAADFGVSAAYLSALEHGHRGKPPWRFVQHTIAYFNIIWDEADELNRLAQLSAPRVIVDTSGLSSRATELANRLAREVKGLEPEDLAAMLAILEERKTKRKTG